MTLNSVNKNGDRVEKLKELSRVLAKQIDKAAKELDFRSVPALAKQYRETIRELEELTGEGGDDDIDELIRRRKDTGAAGAVR